MAKFTVEITDADRAQADAAIEFIRENLGSKADLSDYEFNLLVAIQQQSVNGRLAGITASAVSFFLRETGKLEERKRLAAQGKDSKHLGTVGEKVTFQGMLLSCFPHESDFGVSYCTKMVDDQGNILTWWASNDCATEKPEEAQEKGLLCKGMFVRVTGTVKKHDIYNNQKQTVVTRCKVWTAAGIKSEDEKAARKAAREAKKAAKVAQLDIQVQ